MVHGKRGKGRKNGLVEQWARPLLIQRGGGGEQKIKCPPLTSSMKQGHSRASYGERVKHKMSSKAALANNFEWIQDMGRTPAASHWFVTQKFGL